GTSAAPEVAGTGVRDRADECGLPTPTQASSCLPETTLPSRAGNFGCLRLYPRENIPGVGRRAPFLLAGSRQGWQEATATFLLERSGQLAPRHRRVCARQLLRPSSRQQHCRDDAL